MYTYTCTLAIFILISHRDCVCDNVDISELTWEQKEQVCTIVDSVSIVTRFCDPYKYEV